MTAVSLIIAFSLAVPAVPQANEETAREIETILIAPCCWSQPVSRHYSEAADQIRKQVRLMLAAGKSKQQILDYYVTAYGERILASPRPRKFNLPAYILPWASLLAGAAALAMYLRNRTSRPSGATAAEPDWAPLGEHYASRVEQELRDFR